MRKHSEYNDREYDAMRTRDEIIIKWAEAATASPNNPTMDFVHLMRARKPAGTMAKKWIIGLDARNAAAVHADGQRAVA